MPATNGEIMQTIFPNIKVEYEGVVVSVKGLDSNIDNPLGERTFWRDWWDAPYAEAEQVKGVFNPVQKIEDTSF